MFDRRSKVSSFEESRGRVKVQKNISKSHRSIVTRFFRKGFDQAGSSRAVDPRVWKTAMKEEKKKKRRGRERRKMMKDRASCNMHRIYNTGKSRFIVNLRIPITIPLSALCKDFFQLETFSKPLNSSRWNWNFASREFCVRRILFGRRGLKMFEWKNFTILKAEINLICKSVYNLSSSYEHVCTLTLIDVYIRLNDKISE